MRRAIRAVSVVMGRGQAFGARSASGVAAVPQAASGQRVSTVLEESGMFREQERERWFWESRGAFHEHNLRMSELSSPAAIADYFAENCPHMHRE